LLTGRGAPADHLLDHDEVIVRLGRVW